MVKSKIKFNWAELNHKILTECLWSAAPKVVNSQLTTDKLHSILYAHIKKQFPVIVSKHLDPTVKVNQVYIGGTYYSHFDKKKKKSIEIRLFYNPTIKILNLSRDMFRKFCLLFADTVLHEIIHMRQFRRRKFKILPDYESRIEMKEQRQEQSYLGSSDELDAYSFNIACDLLSKYKNDRAKIFKYLDTDHKFRKDTRDNWKMYLKAFDFDHNHAIIKRLKKKVIRYLPNAEIGKPYRNNDWIDH